jgi:hypothetical protein
MGLPQLSAIFTRPTLPDRIKTITAGKISLIKIPKELKSNSLSDN